MRLNLPENNRGMDAKDAKMLYTAATYGTTHSKAERTGAYFGGDAGLGCGLGGTGGFERGDSGSGSECCGARFLFGVVCGEDPFPDGGSGVRLGKSGVRGAESRFAVGGIAETGERVQDRRRTSGKRACSNGTRVKTRGGPGL